MKKLILALTALGAVGALWAAVPGPAAATVLCPQAQEGCTSTYPSGTELKASLPSKGSVTLTTNLGTVTCTGSAIGGKSTSIGGGEKTVSVEVSTWSFSGCTIGEKTTCTTTAAGLPYSASFEGPGTGNGTFSTPVKVTVVCGAIINCTFSKEHASMSFTGGGPATATASSVSLAGTGGLCPKTSTLSGTWEFSAPAPLFLGDKKASMSVPAVEPFAFNEKRTISITNNGETAWTIVTPALVELAPANGFTKGATCVNQVVNPNGSCGVDVTCKAAGATGKLEFQTTIGSIKTVLNC